AGKERNRAERREGGRRRAYSERRVSAAERVRVRREGRDEDDVSPEWRRRSLDRRREIGRLQHLGESADFGEVFRAYASHGRALRARRRGRLQHVADRRGE